jgi:hypothetical protein
MSSRERFLLPERTLSNECEILDSKVHSDNIIQYLSQTEGFDKRNLGFSSHLSLEVFAPFARGLAVTVEANVFSEQEKESMQGVVSDMPDLASRLADFLDGYKLPVERGRTLYIEPDGVSISSTEIRDGTFDTVARDDLGLVDLMEEGKTPILGMHTHPANHHELFSPRDYIPILVDLFRGKRRFLPAIMAICPDVQVLAFATPQTVWLQPEDRKSFRESWSERIANQDEVRQKTLNRRLNRVADSVDKIRLLEKEGKMSGEESEKYYIKYKRVWDKTYDLLIRAEYLAKNNVLLELARWTQLKFYFSRNMVDFQEFTA